MSDPCPNCGYCPHCKRPRPYQTQPHWQYIPPPTYYPWTVTYGTSTASGYTPPSSTAT